MNTKKEKTKQNLPATSHKVKGKVKNILIAEHTDILAKYRIPIDNKVDFNLQLPDDSDSSKFTDEEG